jgi:hypothetical protein
LDECVLENLHVALLPIAHQDIADRMVIVDGARRTYFSIPIHFNQIVSDFLFAVPPRHVICSRTTVFAWSKTLHAGGYAGCDEVFLGELVGVGEGLDEGEEGVGASEGGG